MNPDKNNQFNVPAESEYFADAPSDIYEQEQQEQQNSVSPFTPPEYTVVNKEQNFVNMDDEQEIANWQAQDLIIGEKDKVWYIGFTVIALTLVIFAAISQIWTFMALVIVCYIAILAMRTPNKANVISYSLSTHGIYIGNKFYAYSEFKSFGIIREASVYSIVFMPKKRFSPSVSIYFSKEEGEKITDIIGSRLPMEEIKHDLIDSIIRKTRL